MAGFDSALMGSGFTVDMDGVASAVAEHAVDVMAAAERMSMDEAVSVLGFYFAVPGLVPSEVAEVAVVRALTEIDTLTAVIKMLATPEDLEMLALALSVAE